MQEVELAKKNTKAEELIKIVQKETEKVKLEKEKGFTQNILQSMMRYYNVYWFLTIAAEEEYKVKLIEEDVALKQKMCAEDLEKAEPALVAAQKALDTLNKVFD